jgi:hypothetical protein
MFSDEEMDNHSGRDLELGYLEGSTELQAKDVAPKTSGNLKCQDSLFLFDEASVKYFSGLAEYSCRNDPPSIPSFRRLRRFHIEHVSQELDMLAHKALGEKYPSPEDLDRIGVLLHQQGE